MADDQNFYSAKEQLQRGEKDSAFELFTAFIEFRESNPSFRCQNGLLAEAYNERGYIRYTGVDFSNAIVDYTKAINLKEDFSVAFYNRGQVHYRLGRYKLAQEDLRRALEINPSFEDAKINLEQIQKDMSSNYRFNSLDPHHNVSYGS